MHIFNKHKLRAYQNFILHSAKSLTALLKSKLLAIYSQYSLLFIHLHLRLLNTCHCAHELIYKTLCEKLIDACSIFQVKKKNPRKLILFLWMLRCQCEKHLHQLAETGQVMKHFSHWKRASRWTESVSIAFWSSSTNEREHGQEVQLASAPSKIFRKGADYDPWSVKWQSKYLHSWNSVLEEIV